MNNNLNHNDEEKNNSTNNISQSETKSSKKYFWKNGKNIAIIILSFLLFCFIIVYADSDSYKSYELANQINELKEKNNELNSKIEDSQNEITNLKDTNNQLVAQNTKLEEEKKNLETEKQESTDNDKENNVQETTTEETSSEEKTKKVSEDTKLKIVPAINATDILEVKKDQVKYEYLINKKNDNNKLIVFNNGAIAGGNVKVPIFQRHSWANILKTSSIFCMDPTLYINDLSVGWGVGKNDNYYLENSSLILKTIIHKMNIRLEDTVIYGTSAGGFLSILMGIYLKGSKVVADNPQLDVSNWAFISAVDCVLNYCFDNIGTALKYPERFHVIDSFIKNNYVSLYGIADLSILKILKNISDGMAMQPWLNVSLR